MTKIALILQAIRLVTADERESWYQILNEQIIALARKAGVGIPQKTDLVGLALGAARKAGAKGEDAHLVAMEVVDRLLTREQSGKTIHDLAPAYLRNTVLPSLVLHLKKNKKTLAQIKSDPTIRAILKRHNFREDGIDKAFYGKLKPNKLVDIKNLGQRAQHSRSSVWDEYMKSGASGDPVSFWYTVATNEARDVLRHWRTEKHKLVTDALRIAPSDLGDFDESRHRELAHDPSNDLHMKLMARRFRQLLEKEGRDFWKAVELIRDKGWDLSDASDARKFEKELALPHGKFSQFQGEFLRALRSVFHRLDLDQEEAAQVMKVAKPPVQIRDHYPELRWVRAFFLSHHPA